MMCYRTINFAIDLSDHGICLHCDNALKIIDYQCFVRTILFSLFGKLAYLYTACLLYQKCVRCSFYWQFLVVICKNCVSAREILLHSHRNDHQYCLPYGKENTYDSALLSSINSVRFSMKHLAKFLLFTIPIFNISFGV